MDENQLNELFFNLMELQQEDYNEIKRFLQNNSLALLIEQQPKLPISNEASSKIKLLAEMIAAGESI